MSNQHALESVVRSPLAMSGKPKAKHHSLPTTNAITKTTEKNLQKKKPIPPTVSSHAHSTPNHPNSKLLDTSKPKSNNSHHPQPPSAKGKQPTRFICKRKRKRPQYHPTPSQPNIDDPNNVKKKKENNKKQTSTAAPPSHHSRDSATRHTSVSPPFGSVISPPHTLHVSKNHPSHSETKPTKPIARPSVTSPVPPNCTPHQSHTTTPHPSTHNSKSPHSSPNPIPSTSFSIQSHPHRAPHPISTNCIARPTLPSYTFAAHHTHKPPLVHLEHVSLDYYSNMPLYHNHQNPQPTCFRVGTNHQQHRSRNQNRSHPGMSLQYGISAFERTHPGAWKPKRSLAHGTHGQVNYPDLPTSMHTSWGPNSHQSNPCIAQIYPIQRNQSLRGPFRVHGYQHENRNQSSCPQTSACVQSNPYPHQNVTQHEACRGGSNHTPSQNHCTLQQPSPFATGDAKPIDRPVKQPSKTPNSTQNRPQNSNETSMRPQSAVQSGMTRSDRPDRRMAGSMNIRKGQSRGTDANPSSQPFAGQPISSAKASRMKLQKRTASPTGEYYGIRCGREGFSGVATCWKSCSVFVVGYRDAVYDLFDTWEKAERFSDRCGTGASLTHRSNFRHFFGGKRNGVMEKGSVTQLPWERENEPKVVSLVVGAASLRFGIGSGIGGYGVFLSLNNPYNCGGLMEGHVTELRLQLKGLLEALEIVYQHRLVKDGGIVELYTASQEIKNGIDHWLGRWDRSGQWVRDGKSVGSQDLWKAVLKIRKELLMKGTKIHTIWVRRPNKVPALQQAVSLARAGFNSARIDEGKKK